MMVADVDVATLLFQIGEAIGLWIPLLLSTLVLVTAAIVVNPIAIVMVGYKITIKATNFGFGLIKRLVRVFN